MGNYKQDLGHSFLLHACFFEDFAGPHLGTGKEPFTDNAGSTSAFLHTLLSQTDRKQFKNPPASRCFASALPCAAAEGAEQQD